MLPQSNDRPKFPADVKSKWKHNMTTVRCCCKSMSIQGRMVTLVPEITLSLWPCYIDEWWWKEFYDAIVFYIVAEYIKILVYLYSMKSFYILLEEKKDRITAICHEKTFDWLFLFCFSFSLWLLYIQLIKIKLKTFSLHWTFYRFLDI